VNLAARAQSAAAAGEILVTQAIYERVQFELAGSQPQAFQLKGFEAPILLYPA
jgi:adenylate cyclase